MFEERTEAGCTTNSENNNLLSTSSMLYSGSENNVDKGEGNETGYFISQASEVTDEVEFGKVLLKDLDLH